MFPLVRYRAAGLACVVITGVNKNGSYVVGERRLYEKRARHAQWNAVLVDGEWRLLDVLWASCSLVRRRVPGWSLIDVDGETFKDEQEDDSPGERRHQTNDFFFLTDPDLFICTHLPDDPDWQLLPRPLLRMQFESFFYVRERFFELGLTLVGDSKRRCVLKTKQGEAAVVFGIPASLGIRAQFRYMLFKKHDIEDAAGRVAVQTKGCVIYEQSDVRIKYTCHVVEVGKYRLDIYGRDVHRHDVIDLVCSYAIVCDATDGRLLPDDPDIGWGPGAELAEVGLVPITHMEGIVYTDEPNVTIMFHKATVKELVFWHCLKHNKLDEATLVSRQVLHMRGDHVIIVVRLPEPGEYAYKLFADERGKSGDIPNVCNYLIRFFKPVAPTASFPPLRWGVLGEGMHALTLDFDVSWIAAEGYINTLTSELTLRCDVTQSDYELFYEIGYRHNTSVLPSAMVKVDTRRTHVIVHLTLSEPGEYGFNMFVRHLSEDSRINSVHSVLINYFEPVVEALALPDKSSNSNDELVGETGHIFDGLRIVNELLIGSSGEDDGQPAGERCIEDDEHDVPSASPDEATRHTPDSTSEETMKPDLETIATDPDTRIEVPEQTPSHTPVDEIAEEIAEEIATEPSSPSPTEVPEGSAENAEETSNETEVSAIATAPEVKVETNTLTSQNGATLWKEHVLPSNLVTCTICIHENIVISDDACCITLPHSEHGLLIAADRKAAQYPVNFTHLQRKGDRTLLVSLPLVGVYAVAVYEVHDNNRLENVRHFNITRIEKVTQTLNKRRGDLLILVYHYT